MPSISGIGTLHFYDFISVPFLDFLYIWTPLLSIQSNCRLRTMPMKGHRISCVIRLVLDSSVETSKPITVVPKRAPNSKVILYFRRGYICAVIQTSRIWFHLWWSPWWLEGENPKTLMPQGKNEPLVRKESPCFHFFEMCLLNFVRPSSFWIRDILFSPPVWAKILSYP